MTTGDQYFSATDKRVLGVQDFRERLIDYVRKLCRDIQNTTFGLDGAFDGPVALSAFAAGRIQINTDSRWSDGAGHFLRTDAFLAGRDVGLAFENTNAVDYDVALHYAERPRMVQINPRTGFPEFVAIEETIGNRADPTSVVNNGNGTMTFNVNGAVNPFGHTRTHEGRSVLVWKKAPGRTATTDLTAMQICTVAFSGGNNTVTTTTVGSGGAGTFGQTSPSVAAADYFVLLLGPTITRHAERNLEVEAGYAYVGRVTGNAGTPSAFDLTGQNQLGSGFAVDLNAITRLDGHGDLKVRVIADALDANEPQIDVLTSGMVSVFSVDEDGDVAAAGNINVAGAATFGSLAVTDDLTVGDDITVTGDASVGGALGAASIFAGGNLTANGNAALGNAEADSHTIKGLLRLINNAADVVLSVHQTTGALESANTISAGALNIATLAKAILARFHALYTEDPAATQATFTTLLDAIWAGAGQRQGVRAYAAASSAGGTQRKGGILTINAARTATEGWLQDVYGDPSLLIQANTAVPGTDAAALSVAAVESVNDGVSSPLAFADSVWTNDLLKIFFSPGATPFVQFLLKNGQLVFTSPFGVTNPTVTQALNNTLCAKNLIKAYAEVRVPSGGALLGDGLNVASCAFPPSGSALVRVTLASAVTNAVPWVQDDNADTTAAGGGMSNGLRFKYTAKVVSTTEIDIYCRDRHLDVWVNSSGGNVDAVHTGGGTQVKIKLLVMGVQA